MSWHEISRTRRPRLTLKSIGRRRLAISLLAVLAALAYPAAGSGIRAGLAWVGGGHEESSPAQGCTLNCGATVPASAQVGQPVSFQGSATPTNCGGAPSYQWDFGDGTTSNQQSPNKTYNGTGSFNWQLQVTVPAGGTSIINTVAGGQGDGVLASQAAFYRLNAIARDPLGRGLFVSENNSQVETIRFINTSGAPVTLAGLLIPAGTIRTLAGGGENIFDENIPGPNANLGTVISLAVSNDGNVVYFVESGDRVRALNLSGSPIVIGGETLSPGNIRTMASPGVNLGGLAVRPSDGYVYVPDATPDVYRVFRIDPTTGGTVTAVGNGAATAENSPFVPGPALSFPLRQPLAVAFASDDSLFIADTGHNRVVRVSPQNNVTWGVDFPPGLARQYPAALAVLGDQLYVANGDAQTIARVSVNGGAATLVSGTAFSSCSFGVFNCGDGGPVSEALFAMAGNTSRPPLPGIAADANGIFVLDQFLNSRSRVRYLNVSGVSVSHAGVTVNAGQVQTIAGTGAALPFDGGLALAALFNRPAGVAVDQNNNLWISDTVAGRVRFVNRGAGPITLFAGTASQQTVPPGGIVTVNNNPGGDTGNSPVSQAIFDYPEGITTTSQGVFVTTIYGGPTIPPGFNGRRTSLLRYINTTDSQVTIFPGSGAPIFVPPGYVATLAGSSPVDSGNGDNGFAGSAKFIGLTDVAVTPNGDIYLADAGQNAVRRIDGNTGIITSVALPAGRYVGLGVSPTGLVHAVNLDSGVLWRQTSVGSSTFTQVVAGLGQPRDVAIGGDGTAYVTDSNGHRILQVSPGGGVSVFAGGVQGFSGDGGPATAARLNLSTTLVEAGVGIPGFPVQQTVGIAITPSGEVVFADTANNRIRSIGGAGGTVVCTRNGTINIGSQASPPAITSLSPNSTTAGGSAFTLTVNGSNFVNGATVRWNGGNRTTSFVNSTQLTASISAADIASAGTATVTVINPDAQVSNGANFTINPIVSQGLEGDVTPRPNGDGQLTVTDWVQVGRFVASLDTAAIGSEFQRADTAPLGTKGDGQLTVTDWVQAGRYVAGLDPPASAGGPTGPPGAAEPGGGDAARADQILEPAQIRAVSVLSSTIQRGQNGTVVVSLLSQGDEAAIGFSINFDPAVLTFVSANAGSGLPPGAAFNVNTSQAAQGRIGITAASLSSTFAAGARDVVSLTFTANASASVNSTSITFGNTPVVQEISSATATPLSASFNSGTVTITGGGADNPVPVVSSLSPTTALAGGSAFTLTVNGSNFVNGATVRWNGGDRTTSFVNSTQLTASISAADIASAGTATVTVFNPTPGGGVSNGVNFTITSQPNPAPTITSLNPATTTAGGGGFQLAVNGTGFVNGSVIQFNGVQRVTTFVSETQLTTNVSASEIAAPATIAVTVSTPAPGGGVSNASNLTIVPSGEGILITSISPSQVLVGGPQFLLIVMGQNFTPTARVQINGEDRPTVFDGPNRLTATIFREDIQDAGMKTITVFIPGLSGGTSNAVTLNVSGPNPTPTVTALNPNSIAAGSGAFTLIVTGTNFVNSSVVQWNGTNRPTTFISANEVRAQISAADVATAGQAAVRVFNPEPGGGTSNEVQFTITPPNPVPTLTSLAPSTVNEGSGAFTLVVNGTGFVQGAVVRWDGSDRPTTFINSTQLQAQISAADVASDRTVAVTVFNPAPGGGSSNPLSFVVQDTNPVPTITNLNPSGAEVGGSDFTLVVNGTGFVQGAVVNWNGQARATTFINSTELRAQISASDIAATGTATVTVTNPAPGGGTSNGVPFTITTTPPNPVPTLTSLAPSTVNEGSGAFTLVVNGTGFVQGAVVRWDGSDRPTTFINSTQLQAQISAGDVAFGRTVAVTVFNPAPGGGSSNPLSFVVQGANPVPTITNVNPSAVVAGGNAFTLVINGTGFAPGAVVNWNGQARATTFINSTELRAQISASDIATAGTGSVTVTNPAPGGGTSNAAVVTISTTTPLPALTSLNPTSRPARSGDFVLTVRGANFVQGSVVQWNGANRATTFVNSTELRATITNNDLLFPGTAAVTVLNPQPGGGVSNALSFAIEFPAPKLTSLTPNIALVGSGSFNLLVNGSDFFEESVVLWNGQERATSLVNSSQLRATIPASDLAQAGTATVTVRNPAPGGVSNSLTFTISVPNQPPVLGTLIPNLAVAGGPAFILTVTGSNFANTSVVQWNGQARPTTFVSPTELRVQIPASDIAIAGRASISVFTPAPGGGTSLARAFVIASPIQNVSAANFVLGPLAPGSIVAAFGTGLATGEASANSTPLPTNLLGTTVQVRDSAGVTRLAPLFAVSPSQVNYLMPAETALGTAEVTITSGDGAVSFARVEIVAVSPGLFSLTMDGQGLASAQVLRIRANGQRVIEPVAVFNAQTGTYVPVPIDLGPEGESVYLIVYGTGIRGRSSLANVSARLANETLPVLFAGEQGEFIGVDQVNLGPIPRRLAGRGTVSLNLTVDGKTTNSVQLNIR